MKDLHVALERVCHPWHLQVVATKAKARGHWVWTLQTLSFFWVSHGTCCFCSSIAISLHFSPRPCILTCLILPFALVAWIDFIRALFIELWYLTQTSWSPEKTKPTTFDWVYIWAFLRKGLFHPSSQTIGIKLVMWLLTFEEKSLPFDFLESHGFLW